MQAWREEHHCRSCAEAIHLIEAGTKRESWLCAQDGREIRPEYRACPLWGKNGKKAEGR